MFSNFRTNVCLLDISGKGFLKYYIKKIKIPKFWYSMEIDFFVGKRLSELRKRLNVSQLQFAKETGIQQSYLSANESNAKRISADSIKLIKKRYPEINLNWLLAGEGEMIFEKSEERSLPIGETPDIVEEGGGEYGADDRMGKLSVVAEPGETYHRSTGEGLFEGLERRVSMLEAWRLEMEGKTG